MEKVEDELRQLDCTDCPDKSTTVDARILHDISTVMKMEKRICLAIEDEVRLCASSQSLFS